MDIVLALGGGGVRGYAHLGVIHVLQQTGFRIRAIAGSSAGAAIGALVASGYDLVEIQNRLDEVNNSRTFQRRPSDPPSLLGLAGVEKFLFDFLGDRNFSDLEIPLVVNAVELETGQLHYFQSGNVLDAVMASIAVPGFFPPRMINNRLFVDGNVIEPVPVAPVRILSPGLPVIAVALSPSLSNWGKSGTKTSLLSTLPVLQRFMDRSRVAQSIQMFLQAVDIGSALITDMVLERDQPEILLRPEVWGVGLLDRVKGDNLVTAGENAVFEQLENIRRASSWWGKLEKLIPG